MELQRRKKHVCSETIQRMLGSIEPHFSRLVVVLYNTAFLTVGIWSDSVYARQLEQNSDEKFHWILGHRKFDRVYGALGLIYMGRFTTSTQQFKAVVHPP